MLRVLIVSLVFLFATASATTVKQCKTGPMPLNVTVEDCDQPPCDAIKGTSALMDVHFVGTKNDIRRLTAKVRATALGITVPYDLPEDVADVCENLKYGATCPIYQSEDVIYRFEFYIDVYYPEINVKVEVSLVDEDKDTIACFIVDVKVKKGAVAP